MTRRKIHYGFKEVTPLSDGICPEDSVHPVFRLPQTNISL